MSVENPEVIDLIGFEEPTGKVVLSIADHLPWDDSEHLILLQGKLNLYLAFIESGEIYESYPRAMGRQLVIDLVRKHSPSVEGYATSSWRSSSLRAPALSSGIAVCGKTTPNIIVMPQSRIQ